MDWKSRVRAAFQDAQDVPDEDVVEELAQHAEAAYAEARAEGLSAHEAEERLGGQLEAWRRDARQLQQRPRRVAAVEPPPAVQRSWFVGLAQDLRYGARLLARQARFTALATVTMALGIGATTVLFSLTYGVLMKPLPWAHASRVVVLDETRGGRPPRFGHFSSTAYLAWREKAQTIVDIAAWSSGTKTLGEAGDSERLDVTFASAALFGVLGVHPLIGAVFEARQEDSRVLLLSEGLWRRRYAADPGVIGRPLILDGQPYTVLGVISDNLGFPDRHVQAWVPLEVRPPAGYYLSVFNAVALLGPGATPAQAAAEATARGRFAADTGMTTMAIFGSDGPISVAARPLLDTVAKEVRRPLLVLLVAVGLLLLTALASITSLQLARASTRRREMAIRAAHGADTPRLARQLLAENLLLALLGGVGGLGLASLLIRLVPLVLPPGFPRVDDIRTDGAVVLFAFALSLLASVLVGIAPAFAASRVRLVELLAEDGAASVGTRRRSWTGRLRLAIIGGQVAVACALLVGASLLGRSFLALLRADRGYDASGVETAFVSLPEWLYSPEQRYAVAEGILERLRQMPGVTAALASELPLVPSGSTASFTMRSPRPEGGEVTVQASPRVVSSRFFSVFGMRTREGRGFSDEDTQASPPVVVVNRTFARRYLGGSPLGTRLPMSAGYEADDREATVIGVVDDVAPVGISGAEVAHPELYFCYRQMNGRLRVPALTLLLRSGGEPAGLAAAARLAVRQADPRLVPETVMSVDDRILRALARPRLYALLLGGFASLAMLVAAVGLFGTLSYLVAQRSRELALRAVFGARPLELLGLVLRQGMTAACGGVVAGLGVAAAAGRSISALLHGVRPYDGLTFTVVPLAVLLVAALACAAPALQAARLGPGPAIRS